MPYGQATLDTSWKSFLRGSVKVIGTIIIALAGVAALIGLSLLMAFPVKWSWNYVMPFITNDVVPEIGFWRAFVLSFLCQYLFKGSGSTSSGK